MFTWGDFLVGVMLPAAVSGGLILAGWQLVHRKYSARDSRSWVGPAAVAAGFMAGYLALFGWPGLPPHDAIDWLLLLAPPLAVLGLLDSYYRVPPPGRVLSIAVAVPVSFLLLVQPLLATGPENLATVFLVATGAAVTSLITTDLLAARSSAGRLNTILLAVSVPATITLMCSGSVRLGMIGMLLSATQVGSLGANIALGRSGLGRGIVLVFGTLLAGLLLCGNLYAELTTQNALLLAAAPCMAWLGRRGPRGLGWLAHVAIQVGLVLAVASAAAIRAWMAMADAAGV
jgi:hypothetical protein